MFVCMNNQQTTSPLQNRPRCYAKSLTAEDTFRPIPGLCMSVRNGLMTEVYKFTYSLRTLQHVPLLVHLSS